jgi:hypothetical protein
MTMALSTATNIQTFAQKDLIDPEFSLTKIIESLEKTVKYSKSIRNKEVEYLTSMAILSAREELFLIKYERG